MQTNDHWSNYVAGDSVINALIGQQLEKNRKILRNFFNVQGVLKAN